MGVWFHPLYALVHAGIVYWLFLTLRTSERPNIRCAAAITALTTAGLVYDNGIIALGGVIGLGDTLTVLSYPRYVLHALVTPMMVFAMVQIAGAGDIRLAQNSAVRWGAGLVALALIPVGVMHDLVDLQLYPACMQGVVRYSTSVSALALCSPEQAVIPSRGPGLAPLVSVFTVLVLGGMLWWQRRWPWAFLGGLIMLVAAALPASRYGLVPGNGGEVFFVAGFAASAARFARAHSAD